MQQYKCIKDSSLSQRHDLLGSGGPDMFDICSAVPCNSVENDQMFEILDPEGFFFHGRGSVTDSELFPDEQEMHL